MHTSQHDTSACTPSPPKKNTPYTPHTHLLQVPQQVHRVAGRGPPQRVGLQEYEHAVKGEGVDIYTHTGGRVTTVSHHLRGDQVGSFTGNGEGGGRS